MAKDRRWYHLLRGQRPQRQPKHIGKPNTQELQQFNHQLLESAHRRTPGREHRRVHRSTLSELMLRFQDCLEAESTAAPSSTLEQRGAGILDPGSSMGYLSADPRTRSTDESRNTTSPLRQAEAPPSDQEEHQANEAIRKAAPKSRRRFFKFWKRTKAAQNGQNETGPIRDAVVYAE